MNLAGDEWKLAGIVALARELAKSSGARHKWIPKPAVLEPEEQPQGATRSSQRQEQSQVAQVELLLAQSQRPSQGEVERAVPSRLSSSSTSSSKCLLPSSLASEQAQRRRSCQQLELGEKDGTVCSRPGRSTTRIERDSSGEDIAPRRSSDGEVAKVPTSHGKRLPAASTLPSPMIRWRSAHALAQEIAAATARDRSSAATAKDQTSAATARDQSLRCQPVDASSANPSGCGGTHPLGAGGSVPRMPLCAPALAVEQIFARRSCRRSSSREEALTASQEEERSVPDRPAREGRRHRIKKFGAAAQAASRLQAGVGTLSLRSQAGVAARPLATVRSGAQAIVQAGASILTAEAVQKEADTRETALRDELAALKEEMEALRAQLPTEKSHDTQLRQSVVDRGSSVPPMPLRTPASAVEQTFARRSYRRSSSREEALSHEEERSAPDRPAREGGRHKIKKFGVAAQAASHFRAGFALWPMLYSPVLRIVIINRVPSRLRHCAPTAM